MLYGDPMCTSVQVSGTVLCVLEVPSVINYVYCSTKKLSDFLFIVWIFIY